MYAYQVGENMKVGKSNQIEVERVPGWPETKLLETCLR